MLASCNQRLFVVTLLVGCASSNVTPAAAPADEHEGPAVTEADPLTTEKKRILEMRAPRYQGSGDKDECLSFLNHDLKDWLNERRDATQSFSERAPNESASPTASVEHLRDIAQLRLDFAREFIAGSDTAIPSSFRGDAELLRAYRGATLDAVRAQLDSARQAASSCLDRAAADSPVRRECEQLSKQIAAMDADGAPSK